MNELDDIPILGKDETPVADENTVWISVPVAKQLLEREDLREGTADVVAGLAAQAVLEYGQDEPKAQEPQHAGQQTFQVS